jgi:hypothetical protein
MKTVVQGRIVRPDDDHLFAIYKRQADVYGRWRVALLDRKFLSDNIRAGGFDSPRADRFIAEFSDDDIAREAVLAILYYKENLHLEKATAKTRRHVEHVRALLPRLRASGFRLYRTVQRDMIQPWLAARDSTDADFEFMANALPDSIAVFSALKGHA